MEVEKVFDEIQHSLIIEPCGTLTKEGTFAFA
jgi:hypothetical protein